MTERTRRSRHGLDMTELIDRLVRHLNSQDPEQVFDVDVEVTVGARPPLQVESSPRILKGAPYTWPDELLAVIPRSLGQLVRSYTFPCMEIGPILLFGNSGAASERELRTVLESETGWSPLLWSSGFLEIGKPATGSFDPVCLDTRRSRPDREHPVVSLDHEALFDGELPRPSVVAPSFADLALSCMGSAEG